MRPLRKAISSQLALFSFERLSLKAPIFEGEGTSNEEVVLRNGLFVDLSHKQPAINSDRPKEMSQWLTPWGDRFVWVATRAAD